MRRTTSRNGSAEIMKERPTLRWDAAVKEVETDDDDDGDG